MTCGRNQKKPEIAGGIRNGETGIRKGEDYDTGRFSESYRGRRCAQYAGNLPADGRNERRSPAHHLRYKQLVPFTGGVACVDVASARQTRGRDLQDVSSVLHRFRQEYHHWAQRLHQRLLPFSGSWRRDIGRRLSHRA